jgi:hypothetical protein
MILQLLQRLFNEGKKHVIYLDNFFSTVELYNDLALIEIGACEIYKAKNNIPKPLSNLRGALFMKNWDYRNS